MSSIQTIIFDFGGVLLNLKQENDWRTQDFFPLFHLQKLKQLKEKNFFDDFEKGKFSAEEFLSKLKTISINPDIKQETIINAWNSILLDIPPHRVSIIQQLKTKYRLILLSNTNCIHTQKFTNDMKEKFGDDILHKYFNTVYYSQEIGCRKPEKEIYHLVMEQQQIKPENILFLDDKPENLEIPKTLGWQTQQVNFNKLSIVDVQHLLN
ncbi:MAG: HAD family phosphatase [Chitinophagales bacterium]